MKLAVFNGSPRGRASNSKMLLDPFLQAINDQNGKCGWDCILEYLAEQKKPDLFREAFDKRFCRPYKS